VKRATEILEREHRTIEKIVRVISVLEDELSEARDVNGSTLRDLCDFLRVYGHQCHQGKEESYLFPLLESRGVPEDGCPLGTLRHEHQRSGALTEALAEAATRYSANPSLGRQGLRDVLCDLACFYPEHIWKEEYLLFPLATKVLSAQEDQLLVREFASVEGDIYRGAYERYEQLAGDLERRVLAASPKMRGMMAEVA